MEFPPRLDLCFVRLFARPHRFSTLPNPAKSRYQSDIYTRRADSSIHLVVWQFWGRAAEASWTEKSRTLFYFAVHREQNH